MLKALSPLALGVTATLAQAQDFDYYLLALTWTPSWCLSDGDPADEQCDPARDLGFTLHGLWPQFDEGWPEHCDSPYPDPTEREAAAMADVMGSGGLARYQWKKHGRCAGLPPDAYFAAARQAFAAITPPHVGGMGITADALERRFLAANPQLHADAVVVTCRDDRVQEVRVCLDRDLAPRACGPDVLGGACRDRRPLELPPVR